VRSKSSYSKKLVIFWFLAAPVPSALTRGDPSPIRILLWIPIFAIFISEGFEMFTGFKNYKKFVVGYVFLLMINILYFFILYTHSFFNYYGDLWHYGYKEVSEYVCKNYQSYEKIVVTNKYGIELPSIYTVADYYILFHCRIDPRQYQIDRKIFNIEIRQPQWRIDRADENVLLVGSRWDFPENFPVEQIIKIIKFPNGKDAFYFVESDGVVIK
jgi:hypothetical protein